MQVKLGSLRNEGDQRNMQRAQCICDAARRGRTIIAGTASSHAQALSLVDWLPFLNVLRAKYEDPRCGSTAVCLHACSEYISGGRGHGSADLSVKKCDQEIANNTADSSSA
jgi:hypothetical protein